MSSSQIPPKSEVLEIYGRVITNSFNLMDGEFHDVGVALYLEASVFDHSCLPNCAASFSGKEIVVRYINEKVHLIT